MSRREKGRAMMVGKCMLMRGIRCWVCSILAVLEYDKLWTDGANSDREMGTSESTSGVLCLIPLALFR